MDRDLWWNLNELETSIMQAEGIISAVMNDMSSPEDEKKMCALWGAETLLGKARESLEAGFQAERRNNEPAPLPQEDDLDGEDSLFAGTRLFSRKATYSFSGDDAPVEKPEAGTEGDVEKDREFAGRFNVTMAEEHEDGSATFSIEASAGQMSKLFETMFVNIIARGLDATKAETGDILDDIRKAKVIVAAKKLEEKLLKWETTDDYDYDPDVLATRMELTDALNNYKNEV